MPNQNKFGRNLTNQGGASSGSNNGIPTNIACCICRRRKPQSQFAGRQLGKFSTYNKAFVRDPNSVKVTCKDCTAGQTTELTCCVCSFTKGLASFAKSQRKTPDDARCIECVNKDLETEPNFPSSDEGSEEEIESGSDFNDWEPAAKTDKPSPNSGSVHKKQESSAESDDGFEPSAIKDLTIKDKKENDTEWQPVPISAARPTNPYGTPWAKSDTSVRTRKNGWAKVDTVPSTKTTKWGEDAAPKEDPLVNQGNKKTSVNKAKGKHANVINFSDSE